jgi:hypothetical protein
MMDPEFIKYFSTLGIGGVLAGFMFIFYRKDMKQYTDQWRVVAEQLMVVIKENTASNSKLVTMIENQERNSIRKSDIEALVDHRLRGGTK